jgi:hypothetical protein
MKSTKIVIIGIGVGGFIVQRQQKEQIQMLGS